MLSLFFFLDSFSKKTLVKSAYKNKKLYQKFSASDSFQIFSECYNEGLLRIKRLKEEPGFQYRKKMKIDAFGGV